MSLSPTLRTYLDDRHVSYQVVRHGRTEDSLHTAAAAHVPGNCVAKAVVLKDEKGYLVAVLPATYKLKLPHIHEATGRHRLEMAVEDELEGLFDDCDLGAVPAVAGAYGLNAMWDQSLRYAQTVFFEGGDHESLVQVGAEDFRRLMGSAPTAVLAEPA